MKDVTLTCVFNDNAKLSHRALEASQTQCEFDAVLPVERRSITSQFAYDVALTAGFPVDEISTTHLLVIQYDGYVINGNSWRDKWLEYDYIGAVWPWHTNGFEVGNGGFSLRSRKLMAAVRDLTSRWDLNFWNSHPQPDDTIICFVLRDQLRREGFKFAPASVAEAFSFERGKAKPESTFGFHGLYNFPHLMPVDKFYSDIDPFLAPYVKDGLEYHETLTAYAKAVAA